MAKFENVKYGLIPSCNNKLREVAVSYNANGRTNRYYIFIRENAKWKDKDYIKEAKARFAADCKAGKVRPGKDIKIKHISPVGKRSGLVFATSFFAITTLALGGLFTWKLLTGGNGGGSDEPIAWKKSTQEKVFATRSTVLEEHENIAPFEFLKTSLNGNQFIISYNEYSEGADAKNGKTSVETYEIDTNNRLYIKHSTSHSTNKGDTNTLDYITFHKDGVYHCYTNESGEKTNQLLYNAASVDESIKLFTNKSQVDIVKEWANGIYGTKIYDVKSSSNEGFGPSLEETIENYTEELQLPTDPELKVTMDYYIAGDSSFKISNTVDNFKAKIQGKDVNVIINEQFNLEMANSLLKTYYANKLIDIPEMSKSIIDQISFTTKKPDTPFVPNDLEIYFPGE